MGTQLGRLLMAGLGTVGFVCLISLVLTPEETPTVLIVVYGSAFFVGMLIHAAIGALYNRFINKQEKTNAPSDD